MVHGTPKTYGVVTLDWWQNKTGKVSYRFHGNDQQTLLPQNLGRKRQQRMRRSVACSTFVRSGVHLWLNLHRMVRIAAAAAVPTLTHAS